MKLPSRQSRLLLIAVAAIAGQSQSLTHVQMTCRRGQQISIEANTVFTNFFTAEITFYDNFAAAGFLKRI